MRFAPEPWRMSGDEASVKGAALVGIAVSDAVVESGAFDGAERHCKLVCLGSGRSFLSLSGTRTSRKLALPPVAMVSNFLPAKPLQTGSQEIGRAVLQPRLNERTKAQKRRCRDGEQNIDMNIDSCFMWKFGIQMLLLIDRHGLALHLRT
ncbi:hypothetical protein [Hoeflea ulvae]|uniref:Uncharacterized protein n=1 Tax=Hoeflea ulvae TaxID=2983764 RepID=A0ABT3YMS4_9HYPH|nr:hypothetical protein [Hoeflea ulvae]MCY0097020.1 hypothetical protein [Hoeflea ulvae]